MRTSRGFTLIEMLIVVSMIGIVLLIAFPRMRDGLVRQNVTSARGAVVSMHAKARAVAIQHGRSSSLVFNGNTVLVLSRDPVTGVMDTVGAPEDLQDRYGVTVTTSSDTLEFDARGLGTSASDTRVLVARGSYQSSIEINPLGRIVR